jgi:hypothetical protein
MQNVDCREGAPLLNAIRDSSRAGRFSQPPEALVPLDLLPYNRRSYRRALAALPRLAFGPGSACSEQQEGCDQHAWSQKTGDDVSRGALQESHWVDAEHRQRDGNQ